MSRAVRVDDIDVTDVADRSTVMTFGGAQGAGTAGREW